MRTPDQARAEHTARGNKLLKKSGYNSIDHANPHLASTPRREAIPAARARGGRVDADAAEDKKQIVGAVHKHEKHDHKGEPLTKLARGGRAPAKTQVNIVVPHGGGGPGAAPMPQPGVAAMPHPPMPGAPPGVMHPPGPPMPAGPMPPHMGPPVGPTGPMKRGGRT